MLKLKDNTKFINGDKRDNDSNRSVEYKKITNNPFYKRLSGRTIAELNESENILVWPTSFEDGEDDIKDQVLFDCKFSSDGKNIEEIQTHNLIGFIGDGKTQIEIRTRFSEDGKSDYFLHYMLSIVLSCNIVDMQVGKGIESALDMMTLFFSGLLTKAVNQGVYKKYVKREYNDSNVRGTIDVSRHIRHNYPSNGRVAYNTREYSYDNDVTQLIRHTIEYIKSKNEFGKKLLSANENTKKCVEIITQITPTYQKRNKRDVINANQKPIVHPHYLHYTALQKLCLAILKGEKMSYGDDNKHKLNGFIIDVAWLWEEYVAKILSTTNLNHYTRSNSSFHLLSNNGATFQKIIPDYYDEEKRIVADAKYTDLSKMDNLSAERAAAIYYKTIMYMYRFNSKIGLLIHPIITNEVKDVEIIEYKIIGTDGKLCKVRIKIPSQCEKFSDFSQKMKEIESNVPNLLLQV